MATELITRTWCDMCTELSDEKTEGTTWRFGINPPGERWTWVEIDLCPDHVSTNFADMYEVLTKYGREGVKPKGTSGRPRQHPATAAGEFICPDCGQATRSKQGLGTHRARIHGIPGEKHHRAADRVAG